MNLTRTSAHSTRKQWRRGDHRAVGKKIGIEIEMVSHASYTSILDVINTLPFSMDIATETDGSLPFNAGMEVVFPPFSYKTLKNKKSKLSQLLTAVAPHRRRYTGAGGHFNVNTTGWSSTKIKAFMFLVHSAPPSLLTYVGGRNLTGYCRQQGLSSSLLIPGASTRGAAAYRGNRIELRFPIGVTSTDDISRVVRFVEFLEKISETEDAETLVVSMHVNVKRSWVALLCKYANKSRNKDASNYRTIINAYNSSISEIGTSQ